MSNESLVYLLPSINASLNATATVFLTLGYYFIRKDKERFKSAHRACMLSAFTLSVVFLTLYLAHKYLKTTIGADINTTFSGTGIWRWVYYPMLLTHVLLAMLIVPLVIITFLHALKAQFDKHRRWARWTFPIWYYVSVTGVLVYFFLYQWFPV